MHSVFRNDANVINEMFFSLTGVFLFAGFAAISTKMEIYIIVINVSTGSNVATKFHII